MGENYDEDTQWNDILRQKGIIPPKKEKEITEEDIVNLVEQTVSQKCGKDPMEDMNLSDLDELEDEEDERVLAEYRAKRIAEMKEMVARSKFGQVIEINGDTYVSEVNNAGEGVWVVLHLYRQGIPLCSLINYHLAELAAKFPTTKFIKSISTTCIPNYPDKNLPTLFIYYEGKMKSQMVGAEEFRANMNVEELEYILGQAKAVPTSITEDPRPKIRDALFSSLNDCNDW
uniref:Viral IAP-associated factor homolog n=1 Tax=Cacopsylla melanoneura TaxID=428564 RepID=A0A8D9BCA4_9HEMI